MSFAVRIDPHADKFLTKLPKDMAERIRDKLLLLKEDPFNYLEHFEGDYYKLRIGDYRALIDVDSSRKIVFVRHIDHRSRIYKRF